MKKIFLFFFSALLFISYKGKAQIDDAPAYQHYFDFSPADTGKIMLDFWNANFLRNTEYFGPISSGYTLFGSLINTQLTFVPNKYLMIMGGIFVRKDYGGEYDSVGILPAHYNTNVFTIIQPTWTVKLQKNGFSLLMGNLEGAMDHRYIEPLQYYETIVQRPLENGLQFKIDKPWLWFDFYIDWNHQEYYGSPYHENIIQGASAKVTLFHPNDIFRIDIPLQYVFFHYGGQEDRTNTQYQTIYNGAAGLVLDWDFSTRHSFISEVKFANYACAFKDMSNNNGLYQYPYTSGNGGYFNLLVKSRSGFGVMASYWDASDWVCPTGGDLYQSISWVYRSYTENSRRLIFLRFYYMRELLPDFYVDLRLEPYYDMNLKFTEYGYHIFLTYKRTFTLTKLHLPKFNDSSYSH